MSRRHDADAGGSPELLAAKAALRERTWRALEERGAARFPGARGRIPNFAGAESAAERLRGTAAWQRADALKANPDSPQLPVRIRGLQDGKRVPRVRARVRGRNDRTDTVIATTVHDLQVLEAGAIPVAPHDFRLDCIVTPDRVIDCPRARRRGAVRFELLAPEKIAAIPLLARLARERAAARSL